MALRKVVVASKAIEFYRTNLVSFTPGFSQVKVPPKPGIGNRLNGFRLLVALAITRLKPGVNENLVPRGSQRTPFVILKYSNETQMQAATVIARGDVIAFRTDTFYGLGADPFNREAVQKIKQLKGREDHKPILIVISDEDQVARFIDEPPAAFNQLAKAFWPGPLTLVGKANPALPPDITAGTKTVGVRLPNDDRVRALVRACGGALTATSANPSNAAPACTAREVENYFRESIGLIVDDGEAKTDRPSTVVDVSGAAPKLIREGVIAWSEIRSNLNAD